MTAVAAVPNERLRLAMIAGQLGYKIFPLKPNTKEPATRHGFKDATSDVEQIDAWWFENPDYNIGLATGMQDNGLFIAVIDVDAKHGGVLAWKQLMRDNGGAWQRYMPIHKTPRSGFHIFGQVDPDLHLNAANGFPRGIDTRGEGGYVVLPDSVFIDTETGEIGSYTMTPNNLWQTETGAFPEYVITIWQSGPQRISLERHPSSQVDEDGPLAWMKANIDWFAELERDGFTIEADFGGEVRWTRPGKTRGTSLSLHLDGNGCVVVWSENCPEWMTDRRCGQPTSDGHWSLNGFQYICARDYGGDIAEAMSAIRREFMPRPTPEPERAEPTPNESEADGSPIDAMCLPEAFWTARPWLTHLRQSAWSVGSVPESVLSTVIARIATMTSPKWMIPAILHRQATFDLITVLVGHTGSGKSGPMGRAEDILPCKWPDRRFGLGIPSGEGIIESYYGMKNVAPPNEKPKMERAKVYEGIHFTVDEGGILATLAGRGGWTGVDRILTAWSGGNLSTPNAKAETFRHVERGTYRFAMTMAIQIELADGLWANNNLAQGFTGRLTMFSGLSRTVPDEADWPEDPGPLQLHLPREVYPKTLSYPAWFVSEVRRDDAERKRSLVDPDPLGAHRNLMRCKLAGIMALIEGRFDVDDLDIELATNIVDASDRIRAWLMTRARSVGERTFLDAAERRGVAIALESDARDRRILGNTVDVISSKLKQRDMSTKELRGSLTPSKKPYTKDALEVLVGLGKIEGGDGRKWHWIG